MAQDLLYRMASDKEADVLMISEQYINPNIKTWFTDVSNKAAIWIRNSGKMPICKHGKGDGFVWIESGASTLVSCYLSPNEGIATFRKKLSEIENFVRNIDGEVILAGDFNAKSTEWGMNRSDTRGRELAEMAASLDLTVLNSGTSTTFRRIGYRETIIDVTLVTSKLAKTIKEWKVMEDYTASDHQYIRFKTDDQTKGRNPRNAGKRRKGWNVRKLDTTALTKSISKKGGFLLEEQTPSVSTKTAAEEVVAKTMSILEHGCNSSMPKRSTTTNRDPVYWWTSEIAELRTECLKLRRQAQRARKKSRNYESRNASYKLAKKRLCAAIRQSKMLKWREICTAVDNDVWGRGYQIVTGQFYRNLPEEPKDAKIMEDIVNELFPSHPERAVIDENYTVETPWFSVSELNEAVQSMANGKAPGPDGVPIEVVKIVARDYPHLLLNMYNSCLRVGLFSCRWKIQRLVLLDKGKGPPVTPASYRPLCMLDVAGKVYEKMLRARLRTAIELAGGLAENQYGFREGRSTMGAINEIQQEVIRAWKGNHRTRKVVVLITFDVKNAFNTLRWIDIIDSLENRFKVPLYLKRVISDYLNNRKLQFETTEGASLKKITAGVAQGSVLGPDLWNAVYDGVLKLKLPADCKLIGFADDLAATILARTEDEARTKTALISLVVENWLSEHGLQLAAQKTEMVILTRQRAFPEIFETQIASHNIQAARVLKYLGVMIDQKLTFWLQLCKAADKADTLVAMLSRLMPNITGPRSSKRRTLMTVAHSIMLYGAEVWAGALKAEKYRRKLAAVQRKGALRVGCAYRTVSEAAILALTGITPIDLLADERKRIYDAKQSGGSTGLQEEEKAKTLSAWRERWKDEDKGRWTARFIQDLTPWTKRGHGELSFHLTQLLTGHGHFNEYLHKMGKKPIPYCDYCAEEIDNAEHTFFKCDRWASRRRELETELGEVITPENIGRSMLKRKGNWEVVARYAEDILRKKKREESEAGAVISA